MNKLTAAVVITTKNRKEELLKAVASALEQRGLAEVLVIDDGSSDGTEGAVAEMLKSGNADKLKSSEPNTAPELRVVRHEESKGYIVRRNEAARLVKADVIFSLDDDAVFSTPFVVEQILREFSHPQIGAVAIPCIEPQLNNKELQRASSPDGIWVMANFKGTAHAVRRDVFLAVGGYREELIHQGEEGDFCVRMLAADAAEMLKSEKLKAEKGVDSSWEMGDREEGMPDGEWRMAEEGCLMSDVGCRNRAERDRLERSDSRTTGSPGGEIKSEVGQLMTDGGERSGRTKGPKDQGSNDSLLDAVPGFFVRMGNSDPIIHNESPRRDYSRMDFYGRRNDILFHWQNTPMPDVLWAVPATIVGGLACAANTGRWWYMLKGVIAGLWQAPHYTRCPVPMNASRAFKQLKVRKGARL